ncbi:hypothetical protein E2562_030099 [Oryza meyeriana var. granulata]|uniref:ABC-2 type transporter transmembrane domain-containing protein n=1 Tax=Oryza meyeriana var. granulata TaxID=110450 RepID=A0A6G1CV13_9ORYZ|nr:hypothetical protein E2562_030099 [Oryza meyeriana var. granulata]
MIQEAITMSIARGKLVSGTSDTSTAAAVSTAKVATYANPWWVEVGVLARRAFTNTRPARELFLIRLGTVHSSVNEWFAIAVSTMFYTSIDALPVFLIERYIYLCETVHNDYRRSSYTLSNAIVSFLALVVLSLAFMVITFFAIGLAGDGGGDFARKWRQLAWESR